MTEKAKMWWGYAVYRGIAQMLDDGVVSAEIAEELVQHYRETIAISASELERKLELLKQQKSA
jgi:predicted nuclease of restriction endonuclease-like RecB superfamily